MRRWRTSTLGLTVATATFFYLVAASGAQCRTAANEPLQADFVQWTKKLNADFGDLNGSLHTNAESLVDFVTKVARLYAIANRIQVHAAAARDDLENDIASGSDATLAKRRALKAFDLLASSAGQWKLYAKCAALGRNAPPIVGGCKTDVVSNFFALDIFGTLQVEVKNEIEQELQGYLKEARALSRSASTLLKLANAGLGSPLHAAVATTSSPAGDDLPVVESPSFTADWAITWSFNPNPDVYSSAPGTMTFRQTRTNLCGRYDFSGGGTLKGKVNGRTFTGESTDKDYGRSTFKMTLSADGHTWSGTWQRDNLSGNWKATAVGSPSRSC